jgi:hypothetical protein
LPLTCVPGWPPSPKGVVVTGVPLVIVVVLLE